MPLQSNEILFMQMKVFFHISYDNFSLLWPSLMKFLCKLKIDQSQVCRSTFVNLCLLKWGIFRISNCWGNVTKYLFGCEICSAGTYFTENLFCRNFLNEQLVPGTYFIGKFILPMWNLFWYLFHDQQWNLFRNEHYKNNDYFFC